MYKHVHVIINPAAGADRPVLSILNAAFQPAEIDWDVFVTKKEGDARRLAQQSAAAGVDAVAVWGGDGTVMEVISGLVSTQVPVAILPGGTGNGTSNELGISSDPVEACALICGNDSQIRQIDLGQIGDNYFMLNAGVGFATSIMEGTEREAKDRLGVIAYLLTGLQTLREPPIAHYHLTLDGKHMELDGITCLIANAGTLGNTGVKLAQDIDVSDGLLDVLIIRNADLGSLAALAVSVLSGNKHTPTLEHWQAREITLVADPPQSVQLDGDVMGQTPFTARVLPGAARIIVPKAADAPDSEHK